MKPVYPKENPERRKQVLQEFYSKIKSTRWEEEEDCPKKPRGRKAKPSTRVETKPRTQSEAKAAGQKYNWFN